MIFFPFIKNWIQATLKHYGEDNCGQLAAAIAYYVLFSVFPLLIFLAAAVGIFLDEDAQLRVVDEVMEIVPLDEADGRDDVEHAVDAVSGSSGPIVGLVALVGMMWSASGMFAAIRRSLNIIYQQRAQARPFVQAKAIDLSLVLAVGVFFAASIAVTAILRVARARSEDLAEIGDLSQELGWLWTLAIILLPFVFSFIAFAFVYRFVPARSASLTGIAAGAFFAAAAFEAVKNLFGFYVEYVANFDAVFGSLGAVAAFLFWVYISAQILLFGAELARTYDEVPPSAIKQQKLEGMGEPFSAKVLRTIRGFFLRDPEAGKR